MVRPRSANRSRKRRLPVPWPILVLIVIAIGSVVYSLRAPAAHAAEHPEPRATAGALQLQPPERYASDPAIAEVYAVVAQIPEVIDGLYCYCHCSEHSDHYSLLSCFEDDHGARCDVCLNQARTAYLMIQQGASLEQIRQVVDQQYGV